MRTVDRGDASEAQVLSELKELGLTVLFPWGDNQVYDCLIDDNGEYIRIQIKTGRYSDGTIEFECRRNRINMGEMKRKVYTDDEIDAYICYCPGTDKCYYVPIEEGTKTTKSLRVDSADKYNPNINWADDYLLTERFK